jgi:hypothetical protein
VEAGHGAGAYQELTVAPAASCLVRTPAELDVARFPSDGKNSTAAISAQGLPGWAVAGLRCQAARDTQRGGRPR